MTASRPRVPRSAASSREFPSTIRAAKYRSLEIGFTACSSPRSRVACRLRCVEWRHGLRRHRLLLTTMQPVLYTEGLFRAVFVRGDCYARGTELETREGPAMMSRAAAPQIAIRDLKSIDDLSQLKAVEKEVWGMADEDTLPLTLAIACKAVGNIFVGAFDKDKLVGFPFGFLGHEHEQTTIHSHILPVLDSYRHLDLGSRLKQAQRERAMAMGVREMTWAYGPLQSRNAPFNLSQI